MGSVLILVLLVLIPFVFLAEVGFWGLIMLLIAGAS